MSSLRDRIVARLPRGAYQVLRAVHRPSDLAAVLRFLRDPSIPLDRGERLRLIRRFYHISFNVNSPHTMGEILGFVAPVLRMPRDTPGVMVEAGCFKGSTTAKFSVVAKLLGRQLVVFDSFEGLPDHDEGHDRNIFGGEARFHQGEWRGELEEVRQNVARYGEVDVCRFVKGWFSDTMPGFDEAVAAAYIDFDLASSTETCLQYLYPRLQPGGVLCSQDGHLPLVIDVFRNEAFWRTVVGAEKPRQIDGLGSSKLIRIVKPAA